MDYINAFWVGGLICVAAQILIDKTNMTPARILVLYVVMAKGVMKAVDANGLIGVITGGTAAAAGGIAAAIFFGFLVALIFDPKAKK